MSITRHEVLGSLQAERRLTLGEVIPQLIEDGLLDAGHAPQLADRGAARATAAAMHPLIWLAENNLTQPDGNPLDLTILTRWLAQRAQLPHFTIDPLKIDVDLVTREVSRSYTARYRILPVEVDEHSVTFATAEPYERHWEEEMAHVLRRDVKRVVANPADILRYQDELFGVSHSIRKAQRLAEGDPLGINNLESLVQLGRAGKLDANDRHVVTIVDWLLQYAFEQRASDIHLEPRREAGSVRFRIDGVLQTVYQIPTTIMGAITSRIKALGRMDVVEKRRPQDGRVKTKTPTGIEIELRLSTMPTAFGEKLVMRIFDPQVLVRDLKQLGFGERDARLWDTMTQSSHGIILVTGPTGSGKTTTLYSTLRLLAQPDVNVCTIEDPIEMVDPAINQMQVNAQIGLDFATGVRTLMRQDPDIVMIGEIRDLETAEMAIQAALTGHLVLSTLHTNDAPSAIVRLMDIGVPPYLINATLLGVVGQRLIRTLCPTCSARGTIDAQAWAELTQPWKLPVPASGRVSVGCEKCRGSGYLGRIGIYESLRITPTLRTAIKPDCDIADLRRRAMREGLEPLRISGARKVIGGITSLDEVLRVAPRVELG
ncbi:MAG: type II/IV secretion system protein [Chromatiaceae bacterium]|nr:type II/IV secretion system protein [Gammaproteobacteria bacterium]MCP5303977.1 type II/IV secretion system protein [Chromatiaceae bacterium]MCP5313704.1 type II/IV secretion system protein [Chromatiaceae bacterium]